MSDCVRPHRQQPTRLPHPWDSPDKNTGVGCHFLLQCMKGKRESDTTLSDPMDCSLLDSSIHGIFQARVLKWVAIAFSDSIALVSTKHQHESATGEGDGILLLYSCLENPMDGGAWWAAVHGVVKSWARLSDFTFTFHFHALEKEMATHSSVLVWRIPGMGEPGGQPSLGSHRVRHD